MQTNGNGKPNQVKQLVKPHILLIGLIFVACNAINAEQDIVDITPQDPKALENK